MQVDRAVVILGGEEGWVECQTPFFTLTGLLARPGSTFEGLRVVSEASNRVLGETKVGWGVCPHHT
jgi:hypothetical protein